MNDILENSMVEGKEFPRDKFKFLLDEGFVLYKKSGIIEMEEVPTYGSISLHYHNGTCTHLTRTETKK